MNHGVERARQTLDDTTASTDWITVLTQVLYIPTLLLHYLDQLHSDKGILYGYNAF